MEGKFNLKYFLLGKGKETIFKTLGYGWRLLIIGGLIILIIAGALSLFRPKTSIVVKRGGQATIIQNEKRAWWIPAPFVEIFGQKTSDKGIDPGMRFGARWEW